WGHSSTVSHDGGRGSSVGQVLCNEASTWGVWEHTGGGVFGKAIKLEGSSTDEGSSSQTHGSAATYIRNGESFVAEGEGAEGDEDPSIMGAIEALEGRVSQLEMDKWEHFLQLAQLVEQMARIMTKD
ncbi:hypothetical protein PIB30_102085, partial [Stylosanthes scabra]|nr:hypothetical protein [Stylosanthes scabra]